MKKLLIFILVLYFLTSFLFVFAEEYVVKCNIENLYNEAKSYFQTTEISVHEEIRGIVITFFIENIEQEFYDISLKTQQKMNYIEYFLAKNKNPVIIEVHTDKNFQIKNGNLKRWEVATVLANSLETRLLRDKRLSREAVKSIGYGEFFPYKNTPNNGVNNIGRVDIIILCSISGE